MACVGVRFMPHMTTGFGFGREYACLEGNPLLSLMDNVCTQSGYSRIFSLRIEAWARLVRTLCLMLPLNSLMRLKDVHVNEDSSVEHIDRRIS
ncbi:hypothetical protein GCM10007972_23880 [Iodidimonas muriae]|uniref:Uncharacterized protein n=1 Tax=Iodidimonas muriae TaxID=261467 RepID=A0ABQ2LHL5_9PROT|nr:hypothetical protein JCM17843_28800 [Kordiimonadales bacterium JCM 17843]GGO15599.1 hypothetical protein GCM10007972_23880 [Iodidimonas muriae]